MSSFSRPLEPYVVRDGDHLSALAYRRCAKPEDIWDAPENARLRELRPAPEILAPGDVIYLPAVERRWLPLKTGNVNEFVATPPRVTIQVCLPQFAGASYVGNADGIPVAPGSVGSDGKITLSVPVLTRLVALQFSSPDGEHHFLVGYLDPIETTRGQRQRLQHLGIHVPDEEGEGQAFLCATALYQELCGLPPTGHFDEDTLKQLAMDHGV